MRCKMCGGHATFDHTVFRGTEPTTVRLCDTCADNTNAQEYLDAIKSAPDHETKTAAVSEFLKALGNE